MLSSTIRANDRPTPPTVANTIQLFATSPLDREGSVSQVDTKSLTTDFSIDSREKDTEPLINWVVDKSQRQVVTDSLDSEGEYAQERSLESNEEEDDEVVDCTLVSQRVVNDLLGHWRRPRIEMDPLQEITNSCPEGQTNL
jgi:hypothetical protein